MPRLFTDQRRKVEKDAVLLVLFAASIWGCAGLGLEGASMQAALQERDAAYVRLAKAIGAYCAARYDSFEARQNCLFKTHLQVQSVPLQSRDGDWSGTGDDRSHFFDGEGERARFSSLRCERARLQTNCERVPALRAEQRVN